MLKTWDRPLVCVLMMDLCTLQTKITNVKKNKKQSSGQSLDEEFTTNWIGQSIKGSCLKLIFVNTTRLETGAVIDCALYNIHFCPLPLKS